MANPQQGFTTISQARAAGNVPTFGAAVLQSALGIGGGGGGPSGSTLPSSVIGGTVGAGGSSKILTFPFDVGDGSSNNHFITFQIREFKPAKVSAARKLLKDAQANLASTQEAIEQFDFGDDDAVEDIANSQAVVAEAQANLAREQGGAGNVGRPISGTSIALKDSQKSKLKQTIALYMPPSVNASYSVSYADQEIGALAHMGIELMDSFFASQGELTTRLSTALKENVGTIKDIAQKASIGALDAIAPGARALQQARTGVVISPRMELMFERVNRRNFSYNFVMIPKSEAEAKMIEQIVQAFKMGMHPEFIDSNKSFRRMKMPDLFEIAYHSHGGENSFINKISTCYLKSVNVTYGGDRYTAHEPTSGINGRGSPPQRTTIALEFTELGILSKEDIQAGF